MCRRGRGEHCDQGDDARVCWLVEGGDSGWRIGYQTLNRVPRRGPWNGEGIWHPQFEDQPAFIVPPIANLGYGPSGVSYYPGTGLPDAYQGHFFLVDFRGSAPVKDDTAVTTNDIAMHNLILWGDAESNQLIAKLAGFGEAQDWIIAGLKVANSLIDVSDGGGDASSNVV